MNAAPATTAQRIDCVNMAMVPSVLPAIEPIARGTSRNGNGEVLIFACCWSVNIGKHGISAKDTFLDECWQFGAGAMPFRRADPGGAAARSIDEPNIACAA